MNLKLGQELGKSNSIQTSLENPNSFFNLGKFIIDSNCFIPFKLFNLGKSKHMQLVKS